MDCTYGVISEIFYMGVNPSNMTDKDTCSPSDYNSECTQALNLTFLDLVSTNVTDGNLSSTYNYTYTYEELWNSSVTVPTVCGNASSKATLYMQYACT